MSDGAGTLRWLSIARSLRCLGSVKICQQNSNHRLFIHFFYLDVGKEIQFTGEENLIKRVKDAETHTRHYDGGGYAVTM